MDNKLAQYIEDEDVIGIFNYLKNISEDFFTDEENLYAALNFMMCRAASIAYHNINILDVAKLIFDSIYFTKDIYLKATYTKKDMNGDYTTVIPNYKNYSYLYQVLDSKNFTLFKFLIEHEKVNTYQHYSDFLYSKHLTEDSYFDILNHLLEDKNFILDLSHHDNHFLSHFLNNLSIDLFKFDLDYAVQVESTLKKILNHEFFYGRNLNSQWVEKNITNEKGKELLNKCFRTSKYSFNEFSKIIWDAFEKREIDTIFNELSKTNNYCPHTDFLILEFIDKGYSELVPRLIEEFNLDFREDNYFSYRYALQCNNIEIFTYLNNKLDISDINKKSFIESINYAAANGSYETLSFLFSNEDFFNLFNKSDYQKIFSYLFQYMNDKSFYDLNLNLDILYDTLGYKELILSLRALCYHNSTKAFLELYDFLQNKSDDFFNNHYYIPEYSYLLIAAMEQKNDIIFNILMKDNINFSISFDVILSKATEIEEKYIIDIIDHNCFYVSSTINSFLKKMVKNNYKTVIFKLLKNNQINFSFDLNILLFISFENKFFDICNKLLENKIVQLTLEASLNISKNSSVNDKSKQENIKKLEKYINLRNF